MRAIVYLATAPQPATGICASDGLNAKDLCHSRMNFKLEDRSEYTRPAKLRKTKKTPGPEIRWKTLSDPCSEPADAAKKDENTKKRRRMRTTKTSCHLLGRSPRYIEDEADAILYL